MIYEMLEICVADVSGRIILNTTIDYGLSTREMCSDNPQFRRKAVSDNSWHFLQHRGVLRKVYGLASDDFPQHAMTVVEVADRLSEFFSTDTLLVEWSNNFCDFDTLFRALKSVGRETIMPNLEGTIVAYYSACNKGAYSYFLSF